MPVLAYFILEFGYSMQKQMDSVIASIEDQTGLSDECQK